MPWRKLHDGTTQQGLIFHHLVVKHPSNPLHRITLPMQQLHPRLPPMILPPLLPKLTTLHLSSATTSPQTGNTVHENQHKRNTPQLSDRLPTPIAIYHYTNPPLQHPLNLLRHQVPHVRFEVELVHQDYQTFKNPFRFISLIK
jgi:hypothetical protein